MVFVFVFLECPSNCKQCLPTFDEDGMVVDLECMECMESHFFNSAGFCNRKHQQCQTLQI